MRDPEIQKQIAEKADNYRRGRAMALAFKPLAIKDVYDAYMCGAADMEQLLGDVYLWKAADGDDLPAIGREVIALTTMGKVVFAHRPKNSWKGKNIDTGTVETYYPERYGVGGWNSPDIKYWLDIDIPNIR